MSPLADDLDRIMAVMEAAFDPEFGEAWNRRQVLDALLMGNCYYELVDADGVVPRENEAAAGFYLSRSGVDEEELLLLAVAPINRRQGLATRLLDSFKSSAKNRGARRILLEMRRGNPAEALYLRHGFEKIGERANYYRTAGGNRLDAITFALDID